MKITIKYFASLREQVGKAEAQLESNAPLTVLDIWQQSTGQTSLPNNVLCAINMEYVSPEDKLDKDAEVAFFPPVTGG